MTDSTSAVYCIDTKSKAVASADGPQPQFLLDTPQFKVLVGGLEAGAQIPVHPTAVSMYYFLEGEGLMTVGEEIFEIKPGVTIVVPGGEKRGINARTRLVFLASKGAE